ncbi:5'-methylthioadenosine/adenosylhomocysteine nucleosidase [Conchiformibius kuhniae]|uniref:5'-methylthioadenosine/S-adenosylhomocysteine nucleosidase n=1 Tax=Conchiformibius kuhniae TaxID=211502 RepID=A0A8T9MTI7_9NEIS|nr:5'-methylthioadenosine/adenosylhomocysteine nucleosidase [Conchiformibius kuhniae]UOP04917.1 5'-methylthioadenosine/adenosylhomocysteine nucleosidase [Conchiformibius kuhniae]
MTAPFSPQSFGIIGAMEPEIRLLHQAMRQVHTHNIGKMTIYQGVLDGKNVALCLSGIGKVNASIATTLLCEHFSPDCIINTGSAGAVGAGLKIGDIIIGTEVAHHDVDVTAFGYAHGQVPHLPARYAGEHALIYAAEEAARRQKSIHCHHGLIVSGDQFIHSNDTLRHIRSRFPGAAALEMEAAAIAQTCWRFDKPFVVIRSISDSADNGSEISFEAFLETAAAHSAQLVRHLLSLF